MNKFENWNNFFEEKEKFDATQYDRFRKTLRIPKSLDRQIVLDLRRLEDEGIQTNYNEYVIFALMTISNSTINDRGEFISKRNGKNLKNYFDSKNDSKTPNKDN